MKLDKAIKNLENALANRWCPWSPELKKSIQLSIEALKRISSLRLEPEDYEITLLPGETPETDSNRSLHHIKEVLESPLGREPKA